MPFVGILSELEVGDIFQNVEDSENGDWMECDSDPVADPNAPRADGSRCGMTCTAIGPCDQFGKRRSD